MLNGLEKVDQAALKCTSEYWISDFELSFQLYTIENEKECSNRRQIENVATLKH